MKRFLDISNKKELFEKLEKLDPNCCPDFGKMTPQHMVEHLAFVIRFSYGADPQILSVSKEKAEKAKWYVINTENELPKGILFPGIGENLPPFRYSYLKEAIEVLRIELDKFHEYFTQKLVHKSVHPVLGELNYQEWIIFHNKHFTHHFKQFGIY